MVLSIRNRKGFLSKTGIFVVFAVFYATLFAFISFAYGTNNPINKTAISDYNDTFFEPITKFFSNIIYGFTNMPLWLSGILLVPLVAGMGFLIITSLPTMNGGA